MRKINAWLLLTMFVACVACKDDDDEPANAITPDEAAVVISSSFASNTSGVAFVPSESADATGELLEDNAGGRVQACGLSRNVDLSGSSPDGAQITWSYDFSYKFVLHCTDDEKPESVSADLSYSGDFDGPKLAAEHSGLSELDLTGLADSLANFTLAGTFKRTGSFEQKEGELKSGNNTLEVTLEDVVIDKQTHKIISGTGDYVLDGTVSGKGDFHYDGTVTFQGEDAAELNVKGTKFKLNLKTGDVNKNQ